MDALHAGCDNKGPLVVLFRQRDSDVRFGIYAAEQGWTEEEEAA